MMLKKIQNTGNVELTMKIACTVMKWLSENNVMTLYLIQCWIMHSSLFEWTWIDITSLYFRTK